jgi:hypothetical protein
MAMAFRAMLTAFPFPLRGHAHLRFGEASTEVPRAGIQGELGIGLLSFWTVGERLVMTSTGSDQRAYQMTMNKGDPSYEISPRRVLFAERGTEVRISPLLEGMRTLSGEKIQWYLASELRDRIRSSELRISVMDKLARKQLEVEPRQFDGRLLHQLPSVRTSYGDAYVELYLTEPAEPSRVALYRSGTRVVEVQARTAKRPGICQRIKCWARPNRSPRQSHSASSSNTQDRSSVSLSRRRRARLP